VGRKQKSKRAGPGTLGGRIKTQRLAKKLTQAELARRIGTDKASVCHWEQGDYTPSSKYMPGLASELGCSTDFIFSGAA